MKSDDEMIALETRMLAEHPGLEAEVRRYEPSVRKLTNLSLVAIRIAISRESRKRTVPYGTIGNRADPRDG